MNAEAQELLREYQLRQTDSRIAVLDFMLRHPHAISQPELEQQLADRFDRVTLYRTLNTFNEKGLIHEVADTSGTMKFALCGEACHNETHSHRHEHVHFHCTQCQQTVCINEVDVPQLALPAGFLPQKFSFIIEGSCQQCQQKNEPQ